ncbi:MAG: putative DNAse [Methanosaeta sp. PtaB.Bin039]|nr:MAG: putative DNAse [Methanosaeta sp. PtaB.Bin039]OPY47172.1 MAG: putative DNAse [Methanosaeta sp. PtaU1.Bin028]HOT06842.1 TatD family hydrolase [Methanotrichaceae archaeon]HQF16738.1 TatD family hydrolase [Methanotrichaceae archaeon]HQI91370.1 TatD family hydrolase [Methanotrichaceae archaeon]
MNSVSVIDAHCHLDFKHFSKDRAAVMDRARSAGIVEMINSGVDLPTNRRTMELVRQYPFLHATLGLSPNSLERFSNRDMSELKDFIRSQADDIIGVGEAGLDYYRVTDPALRARQVSVFQQMIDLAAELDKPLVIHARDTEEQAFQMVKDQKKVVFHCYSGSLATMKQIADKGFYISIATVVCRSVPHQAVARQVPIDQLLIETDSPFLSPRRGRNEPAFVLDSVQLIARLRGMTPEALADATVRNTRRIYGI